MKEMGWERARHKEEMLGDESSVSGGQQGTKDAHWQAKATKLDRLSG